MTSIISQIIELRNGQTFSTDCDNHNRYCIIATEEDGSRTGYYYSVPIYNRNTGYLVDPGIHNCGRNLSAIGSNCNINIQDEVVLSNVVGICSVRLPCLAESYLNHNANEGDYGIKITSNGIACGLPTPSSKGVSITLKVSVPYMDIWQNDMCLVLKNEGSPFVTVSCVGVIDNSGEVVTPLKIMCEKKNSREFLITFKATKEMGTYYLFEVNLYENKLLLDTSVDSKLPASNNAYGGVAFIGHTVEHGESWLYSKLECNKIPELLDKKIITAVLHIPKLNHTTTDMFAFQIPSRFCSLGSTWNNKISNVGNPLRLYQLENWIDVDITCMIQEALSASVSAVGMVIKPHMTHNTYTVISTSDSCLFPQILEIKYK